MKNSLFILVLIVLALVFIIIGFSLNVKDYAINILAEMAGLFIGVIVAVLLVDRLTENQRKRRWARVRELTHRTISHHLSNIILELFNHLPLSRCPEILAILENRDQPNLKVIDALNNITEQIKNLLQDNKILMQPVIDYYNTIKWDVNQIRLDLIPRVMQSSDDQDLINALVEFDDKIQDIQTAMITHKHHIDSNILARIVPLLETIQDIYKYL
ncbi:MAG: hypothetical protein N2201_02805 [candidate division WOR-3 bacterium]|nr:hypothetical protein [candidate division WOR-3 bacterium]